MDKKQLEDIIPIEGRKKIQEARKRLDSILEITQCIHCKKNKPLNEFSEDINGYLGFSRICLACNNKLSQLNTHRICKKCGELKENNFFYKIRRQGYFDYCIECTKDLINEKALKGATKKCACCGKIKAASTENFYVTVTCKDMLKPLCKICSDKRKKEKKKK